jgi:AcrR family transcriptional regulator
VPRLWQDSIDAHREAVRDAVLDAVAALVAERGLRGVTMSRIASDAGIGRATLYKYFSDVEELLAAWHQRQVAAHLQALTDTADRPGSALDRLRAALRTYADSCAGHEASELATLLHRGEHVAFAQAHLRQLVAALLREAAAGGEVRDDVPADELAAFCLHALTAASAVRSKAAIGRLVDVTVRALTHG